MFKSLNIKKLSAENCCRVFYFMVAIAAMLAIGKWGLGWSNVQIIRQIFDKHTLSPAFWEIWLAVLGAIISVFSLSIIYVYASRLMSLLKRELKYVLLLIMFPIMYFCCEQTKYWIQNSIPPIILRHGDFASLEVWIKQLSIGESLLAIFLGFLFSSHYLKAIIKEVSDGTLKDLVQNINHWKSGGIVCSFEQLRTHDPIVRKRYKDGFTARLENPISTEEIKTEDERKYVGQKLRDIRDLKDADFLSAHETFLRGVDLSRTNLCGVSFAGKKLEGTSFKKSELTGTDFSNADLTGGNFAYSQIDKTKFQGAILTGICIESWGLGSGKQLPEFDNQTVCTHVFLRENEHDKCPENDSFEDGEFADICRDILTRTRIIFRRNKSTKGRYLALLICLQKYPNETVRGYGQIGRDCYADIQNPQGDSSVFKREFDVLAQTINELRDHIEIVGDSLELVRFQYNNLSEELFDKLQSLEAEVKNVLPAIIQNNGQLHEFGLKLSEIDKKYDLMLEQFAQPRLCQPAQSLNPSVIVNNYLGENAAGTSTHFTAPVNNSSIASGEHASATNGLRGGIMKLLKSLLYKLFNIRLDL
jgi:hypothetical protein